MNNKSKIENSVMQSIKKDKTHMNPKWYYSLITFLWIALISLFGFISIYIFSIISFWMRLSIAKGPAYGARQNLSTLINNFPWWIALLSIVIFAVTIYLARKHSSLYKIKLIVVIPVTIAILAIAGLLLSYSNLPIFNIVHNQNSSHSNR